MAKSTNGSSNKVVFFKTKGGKAKKKRNKHDKKSRVNRGQGKC